MDADVPAYFPYPASTESPLRQAEEEMARESETRYRTLFELMDEGFCVIEVLFEKEEAYDYRFLEANPAFKKHTGIEAPIGKTACDLNIPQNRVCCNIYANVAITGEPARFESEMDTFGHYYDVHAFRIGTPEQRHVAILFNQITERKRAEENLARAYAKERKIAQMLQGSLLLAPPERFPGLSLVTRYQAAMDEAQVGGDFYDAFSLGDGKIALVVGDAAGKGLSAAAQIAEVKYALHIFLRETPNDPVDALKRLNRFVYQSKQISHLEEMASHFVALSLAVIAPQTGQGIFVAAGMDSPICLRGASDVSIMASSHYGVALGIVEDTDYTSMPFEVVAGDLILLASDGITEARTRIANGDGSSTIEMLEMTGVARLLQEHSNSEPDARVGEVAALRILCERVVVSAREYSGGKFADDVCLLLACVTM